MSVQLALAPELTPDQSARRRAFARLALLGYPDRTLADFAGDWGVSKQELSRWLKAPTRCSVAKAQFYVARLGASLDEIYT